MVVNSAITKVIEDNEKMASASLNDLNERKLDASAYTPTDLSDYYKKEETSGKTELDAALKLKANSTDLATKANTADLTAHTGNSAIHITSDERTKWSGKLSNVQYSKTDKKIYFYSGATSENPVSTIDATDFIKDGMVSNVEIKDVTNSGSCLVITFNADSGKQDINIPISKIFNPENYYLKTETSGKTEISTALGLKANSADLTAHTSNSTIHITADERTKWNNAASSSHTHANKAVLDTITAIDTKLSETSNNLVVNSAITKVILDNEKIASSSLNDLNERKLDASAYTPTDLSDYYKKEETSGKTEIATALGLKADTSALSGYYKKTETSGSTQLTTALGLKADTSALTAHTGNSTVHITSDERTKWNGKVSNVQYNKTDKKIYFYSGATTETPISNIDATDFIKDGMVSNVEIKNVANSGSCLVITFNADAGKQDITIPVTKIFNPANYYLKSETSGKTEIATALNSKANTGHTHLSSDITDKVTGITESNSGSTSVPTVSAVMQVFKDNEKTISASLNDLNDKISQLNALIEKYDARIKALESK